MRFMCFASKTSCSVVVQKKEENLAEESELDMVGHLN